MRQARPLVTMCCLDSEDPLMVHGLSLKCTDEAISEFKQAHQANLLRIMVLGFLMHIQSRKESMKLNCAIKLSGENIY